MIDGFSGYNQVVVHPKDMENIAFMTPWGTFMYTWIPFVLINAGATFQKYPSQMLKMLVIIFRKHSNVI
jgi:hypothetical protein